MAEITYFDLDLSKIKWTRATKKQIDFLLALGIRAYLQEQFSNRAEEMYQEICNSKSSASFYINELLRLERKFEECLRKKNDLPKNHQERIPIITEPKVLD